MNGKQLVVLRRRADFLRAQEKARRFRQKHLILLVMHGGHGQTRVGYTVSRRVGTAVVRNRVRRRLREIMRAQAWRLKGGQDYVCIALPASGVASFATLQKDVACALNQAGCRALGERC